MPTTTATTNSDHSDNSDNSPPVLLPEVLELLLRWKLAAGQLQGDLHAVGEQVVEVLDMDDGWQFNGTIRFSSPPS